MSSGIDTLSLLKHHFMLLLVTSLLVQLLMIKSEKIVRKITHYARKADMKSQSHTCDLIATYYQKRFLIGIILVRLLHIP